MKILFVGKTDFQYNRDLVLINGLKKRSDVTLDFVQIKKRNWSTFQEISKKSKNVDFVYIPSFRHKDVLFIKMASKAKIVFDPLISKYMTRVLDYGQRWKGVHKHLVDWLAFFWPDLLVWDTEAHRNYIKKKYRLNKPIGLVYIGVDTSKFHPIEKEKSDKFTVGFYGSFNPLQGIDKIIRTAALLKEYDSIEFKIIGAGSTFEEVKQLAEELDTTNVQFLGNVPFSDLNEMINGFDLCLGVFGDSLKTDVVIPNKIFHYAAAGKCIITKDTKAVRELFSDKNEIVLTLNTPDQMAESILKYKQENNLRNSIGRNAHSLVSNMYNEDKIAEMLVSFLKSHI